MRTPLCALGLTLLLTLPSVALAQGKPTDRVAFGDGVRVPAGEVVRDAVAFGGDTVVEGVVEGDAVSFGGSVILRGDARVGGDVTAFGGEVRDERAGVAEGVSAPTSSHSSSSHETAPHEPSIIDSIFAWFSNTARSAVAHVFLFLLGLLLIGVGRERLGAMQVTMIKDSFKTAGAGLLGYAAAVVAIVLLCITIIGIPVAVVAGLALPVATYIGLAAAATVIGAMLPLPQLQGKETAQLAAGVGVLFVASLVPVVGGIATAVAACLGFGALLRTRFRDVPPSDLPAGGPYRSSAGA